MENTIQKKPLPQWVYMALLISVILAWGAMPVINRYMYTYYSASVYTALMGLFAAITLFLVFFKDLNKITANLLKISIPTGLINAAAAITQKIGLRYTTPTKMAFLDTLSCIAVPVVMFIITRKRPSVWKIVSAVLCLAGCFVITGASFSDFSVIGIGEILSAIAGILYGVNIAVTGVYAKKIYAPMHVMIHTAIQAISGFATAIVLNLIVVDGVALEPFKLSLDFGPLLAMIAIGAFSSALCWIIRINVQKHIDATVVGVMMPMYSVVTGFISVIAGTDTLSSRLVIGGALGVGASIISNLSGSKRSDDSDAKGTHSEDKAAAKDST